MKLLFIPFYCLLSNGTCDQKSFLWENNVTSITRRISLMTLSCCQSSVVLLGNPVGVLLSHGYGEKLMEWNQRIAERLLNKLFFSLCAWILVIELLTFPGLWLPRIGQKPINFAWNNWTIFRMTNIAALLFQCLEGFFSGTWQNLSLP